jgi:Big-like domain-containing protein
MVRRMAALLALALAPAVARAQYLDREAQYGKPVDVSLSDLALNPEQYLQRAVRTKGRLQTSFETRDAYTLSDMGAEGLIVPVSDVRTVFDDESRKWLGQQIEITGIVTGNLTNTGTQGRATVVITFWGFTGPDERDPKDRKGPVAEVSLESLLSNPGKNDGKTVRVFGQFRGRNLFGDLPSHSQASSDDFVIKDDLFAVWISGKKPKGSGWALDASLKRDTGKWMEVVGRPETRNGVVYIRASEVKLSSGKTAAALPAQPPPPPPERPKVAPVVVFALPLDGDAEVARDSRFVVQFSKDMDEATFAGHVVFRYAGPVLPGDRLFEGMKLTYDQGRRALTVDPGDLLRPGRQIELILLPGIVDIDGLPLSPRGAQVTSDVADVLHYLVGI